MILLLTLLITIECSSTQNENGCRSNCQTCNDSEECLTCITDYYILENGNCHLQCSENCSQNDINLKCIICETSICQDNCLDIGSIFKIDSYTYFTYQTYTSHQYQIQATVIDDKTKTSKNIILLEQDTNIQYHKVFNYKSNTMEGIALIWLNGNCIIQCRLMLQLFEKNLQLLSNSYELKLLTTNVKDFEITAQSFNDEIIMIWNELNSALQNQYFTATFTLQNGFQLQSEILENSNDRAEFAQIMLQSGYYQIIYVKNGNTISAQIVDGLSVSYRQLYQTKNDIEIFSLSVLKQDYTGIIISWIEKTKQNDTQDVYCIYYSIFDLNLLLKKDKQQISQNQQKLSQMVLKSFDYYNVQIVYVENQLDGKQIIKQQQFQPNNNYYKSQNPLQINILSEYTSDSQIDCFIDSNSRSFILFQGIINNQQQIFYSQPTEQNNIQNNCQNSCFYCNINQECLICQQNYELINQICEIKLPQYCEDGDNGYCAVCQEGYTLQVSNNQCQLSDEKYKEQKINVYQSQSKQRISTFSNGDYISVWFRQYYSNEGTGVFMALFNVQGEKLIDETRISQSAAGIQIYPDVQVFSNDQFCAIWIEGDLQVQGKIKIQRFTKTFERLGDEITIKDNIQLRNVQRFDTPIIIQSIINGYVIIWTQNSLESNILVEKLYVNFYNSQDQLQKSQIINNSESIKNSEPVVSSNTNFIIIVWQSNLGIIASKFSLNFVYVDQMILNSNGISPSIIVTKQNEFLIVWSETVTNNLGLMSQKICYRKYLYDISHPEFNLYIGIQDYNLYNPDIIPTNNGYAIIFESRHSIINDVRNIRLIVFDQDGSKSSSTIIVTDLLNTYPHHPQLTSLPQNQFLVTWISSPLDKFINLQDDLYMKRYNSGGVQLPLDSIICWNECISCLNNLICQECQAGYILLQNKCVSLIPNCLSYDNDSPLQLICKSCVDNYKLLKNLCILIQINDELNIEYLTNIPQEFNIISLQNDELLYFWSSNQQLYKQRFNKYGKQIYSSQIIQQIDQNTRFAVQQLQNNFYVLLIQEYCQFQFSIFNNQEESILQFMPELYCFFMDVDFPITLKLLGQNRIILFYQTRDQQQNLCLYAAQFFINFQEDNINSISQEAIYSKFLQADSFSQGQEIEIGIFNSEITIQYENNDLNSYRYYLTSFDIFGNMIRTYKTINKNEQIELELLGIDENTILEVWTQLIISKYEIFYQIKDYNGTLITQPTQISQSDKLYKVDVKITKLKQSIAITWREGSISTEMSQNSYYKIRLLDSDTYTLKNPECSLNNFNPAVISEQTQLKINQLENEDIVISMIVLDLEMNINKMVAYKLNNNGEKLSFEQNRCNYGCQLCNNDLQCTKCFNDDDFILTNNGQCQDNSNCQNTQSNCFDCLDGFYKNQYGDCEQLQQIPETEINFSINQYNNYDIAFYKDRSYTIVYQKEDKVINAIKFNQNGSIFLEQLLEQITLDDYKFKKLKIITDQQNNLYVLFLYYNQEMVVYNDNAQSYYYVYDLIFNVTKYDGDFNKLGESIFLLKQTQQNQNLDEVFLDITISKNNNVCLEIVEQQLIFFMVYDQTLSIQLSNIQINKSNSAPYDILITEDLIIIGYIDTEQAIVKFFDQNNNFINDMAIQNAYFIKLIQNSEKHIIAFTSNQLTVISNTNFSILYSQNFTIPFKSADKLFIDDQDRIFIIHLYQYYNKESQRFIDTLFLKILSNQYEILKDIQINTRSNILFYNRPMNCYQLQNYQYVLTYQAMIDGNWKLLMTQFDKDGSIQSIFSIVCPEGCQQCASQNQCTACFQEFQLDIETSNCQKSCLIDKCQECVQDICVLCQDLLVLQNNQCIKINNEPRNLQNQLYLDEQCDIPFSNKFLKYDDTLYIVILQCQDQIYINHFNSDYQINYTYIQTGVLINIFDTILMDDIIYFSILFTNQTQIINIYTYKLFSQSLNLYNTINGGCKISNLSINKINTNSILLFYSFQEIMNFEQISLLCNKDILQIYDNNFNLIMQKSNFDILPEQQNQFCSDIQIHQVNVLNNILYILEQNQNLIQVLLLNQQGNLLLVYSFNIQNVISIKFDVNQNYIALIFQQSIIKTIQLLVYDRKQQKVQIQKVIINEDSDYDLALKNNFVIITQCSKQFQTVAQYMIITIEDGIVSNQSLINTAPYSFSPKIFNLESKIYLSWVFQEIYGIYQTAFIIINDQGQLISLAESISCDAQCVKCENNNCQQCGQGYYLYNNTLGTAYCRKQCKPNCEWCERDICRYCQQGFVWIDGDCVTDDFFNKAFQINEFSTSNQIQPVSHKFQDGNFLLSWTSNNADGDSWGVFAQLFDNQGKKIGNNFMVSQTNAGNQYSSSIDILEDNTAIIIFIEGDIKTGALLKGCRYTNNLEKLGNEQLFANIQFSNFIIGKTIINCVLALSNGGFVIIWLQDNDQNNVQLMLSFYDSASNLVSVQQVDQLNYYKHLKEFDLQTASTKTDISIIYYESQQIIKMNIYSLIGDLIASQIIYDKNIYQIQKIFFSSITFYYVAASVQFRNNQNKVIIQYFNNQAFPIGNEITFNGNCEEIQSQLSQPCEYLQIQMNQISYGVIVSLTMNYWFGNYELEHYIIDNNWNFNLLLKTSSNYYNSKVTIIESQDQTKYFLVWSQQTKQKDWQNQDYESSNVFMQSIFNTGEISPIDSIVCIPNCKKCTGPLICSECLPNFQNQQTYCSPICGQNCQTCFLPNICEICNDGYYQKIQGKCVVFPYNYFEPQNYFVSESYNNIIGLEKYQNEQTILYTQQTLYSEMKEIFSVNIFNKTILIKNFKVQTNTITTNYYTISPFYINENLILIFYMYDRIRIIKFNDLQEQIEDSLLPLTFNSQQLFSSEFYVIPQINNGYYIYYNSNKILKKVTFDENLNFINEKILYQSDEWLQYSKKTTILIELQSITKRIQITNDKISQQNCLYSEKLQYSGEQNPCNIYQLGNGNKIQIFYSSQSLDYYNYYNERNRNVVYRILDQNDIPLTIEASVIENSFNKQSFVNVLIFQNSFSILIEQLNYVEDYWSELYLQRFDNSGQKIDSPQYLNSYKQWRNKFNFQTSNGFEIHWSEYDIKSQDQIGQPKIKFYSKSFTENGEPILWIEAKCIDNCVKCINSFYCQQCIDSYELDENQKCKLICSDNCQTCQTTQSCLVCEIGYQLENEQCSKIVCVNNCAQCQNSGTCSVCNDNYILNSSLSECLPQCPSNCSQCNEPLKCSVCSTQYVLTSNQQCQSENTSILDQIKNTTVGTPIVSTFPDGCYILMWYQNGNNAGVYFQLYDSDNTKVGVPIEITQSKRRLLNDDQITQQFYADVISIDFQFYILWMDSSQEQLNINLNEYDSEGALKNQLGSIGVHDQVDLSEIKVPCQIKKTANNNVLLSYMAPHQNDDTYSLYIKAFDSELSAVGSTQEIKKVNQLAAPSIVIDDNGLISITYQKDGYIYVQQLTQEGEFSESPKMIGDSNSLTIKIASLENTMMVFLWENKNLQLAQPQFSLNYQLISKDLKTRSEIKSISEIQVASLTPDILPFNDGFIVTWRITDSSYKSSGLQFQIFNSLGSQTTSIVDVDTEGANPSYPRIQIINNSTFAITWTAKNIDVDGTELGDSIFMQKYNQNGIIVTDSQFLTDLCSYQCQSCQSPLICLKCQYGFYLDSNNQCKMDCGTFCDECEIPWTCQVCKNGYELNNNDACIETECLEGYKRNTETKICDPECPEQCQECKQPNICLSCKESYTLSGQECTINQQNFELDTQQTIMAIVIILLVAAFMGLLACTITLYCKYKKLLKQLNPNFCQVHPQQEPNKSISCVSCNVSVSRMNPSNDL